MNLLMVSVADEQVFFRALRFSAPNIIPAVIHNNISYISRSYMILANDSVVK